MAPSTLELEYAGHASAYEPMSHLKTSEAADRSVHFYVRNTYFKDLRSEVCIAVCTV